MGQFERHVFVCTSGDYCPHDGSAQIHRLLKEGVAARGLKASVRINKSGCLDQCGHGPMVVVYPDDVWYAGVTPDKARRILDEHLVAGRAIADLEYRAPAGPNKDARRMAAINAARAGREPGGRGEA